MKISNEKADDLEICDLVNDNKSRVISYVIKFTKCTKRIHKFRNHKK